MTDLDEARRALHTLKVNSLSFHDGHCDCSECTDVERLAETLRDALDELERLRGELAAT